MITCKIDVTKIDKTKLFKGEKGTYLDFVLFESPNSKYGDYMIVQSVSKEERSNGVKGAILGNGKTFQSEGRKRERQSASPARPAPTDGGGASDDVPF